MAEFRSVTVQRLSFWTVTKLFLLGTCISFAIIFVCMAALAIFGFGPLVHAPYPVSGASAFVLLVFTRCSPRSPRSLRESAIGP